MTTTAGPTTPAAHVQLPAGGDDAGLGRERAVAAGV